MPPLYEIRILQRILQVGTAWNCIWLAVRFKLTQKYFPWTDVISFEYSTNIKWIQHLVLKVQTMRFISALKYFECSLITFDIIYSFFIPTFVANNISFCEYNLWCFSGVLKEKKMICQEIWSYLIWSHLISLILSMRKFFHMFVTL